MHNIENVQGEELVSCEFFKLLANFCEYHLSNESKLKRYIFLFIIFFGITQKKKIYTKIETFLEMGVLTKISKNKIFKFGAIYLSSSKFAN